jgi:VIT1/CCC1 family predicted Fe2+/Mn2+ transporter
VFILKAADALVVSAVVTIFALFVFGYVKSVLLGNSKPFVGAMQMMLIGTVAAVAAYGIAKAIPNPGV